MIVEMKRSIYESSHTLSKKELGVKMATVREQEGQTSTHLLFSWYDKRKDEVVGTFSTLPLHLLPAPFNGTA